MTSSAEANNCKNVATQLSLAAAHDSSGLSKLWAYLRAFMIRRRTFMGIVVAFGLLLVANPKPYAFAAGLVVIAGAHALRLFAAGYLDKDNALVTEGPFAWCRNPLYVANYLVALGFALLSGQWVAIPIVLLLCTTTQVPTVTCEEQYLREKFGAEFEEYCRRVPRWLPRPSRRNPGPPGEREDRFSWALVFRNQEHLNILSAWLVVAMFVVEMVK